MSKPSSAPPKPNLVVTVLWMVALFFLINSWLGPKNTPPQTNAGKPVTTRSEAFSALKAMDAQVPKNRDEAVQIANDAAQKMLPSHKNFASEEVKKKTLTEADEIRYNAEAAILTAHVQLEKGLFANDSQHIRMAYQTLEPLERTLASSPVWTTPIEVIEEGKKETVSGHQIYQNVVNTLSERNKSDLIWGFLPGGYQFIDFLVGITGHNPNFSYAFAAFLLAFIVRAIVFPLAQKQLVVARQMSQLTPRLTEIREKYKDNQAVASQKTMELYSRYGINPFAGCGPAFVQMPLFLTVYQCMLHYQFEFTKGFFLWINPGSSAATKGFFAPNLGQQDYLLILIYGVTMVISTLLTPVSDPTQARQQRIIGLGAAVIFPIMMALRFVPVVSGFVLYWTFTNLFSMAQSIRAYRMPMPPLQEVNAAGGGVVPGKSGKFATWMADMQKMAAEQQNLKEQGLTPDGTAKKPKVSDQLPKKDDDDGGSKTAKHKPKKRK